MNLTYPFMKLLDFRLLKRFGGNYLESLSKTFLSYLHLFTLLVLMFMLLKKLHDTLDKVDHYSKLFFLANFAT